MMSFLRVGQAGEQARQAGLPARSLASPFACSTLNLACTLAAPKRASRNGGIVRLAPPPRVRAKACLTVCSGCTPERHAVRSVSETPDYQHP